MARAPHTTLAATLVAVGLCVSGCPEVNPEFVEPSGGNASGDSGSDGSASDTSAGSGSGGGVTGGADGTSGGAMDTGGPPPTTGGPSGTCEQRFGDAPGYQLCDESRQTCTFSAFLDGSDCAQLCSDLDSECVDAFDNPPPGGAMQCNAEGPSNCETNAGTQICVCLK